MESKGGRIALLIFMVVVLVYTAYNFARGTTNALVFGFAIFLALTTGSRIVQSLIEDFKK